MRKDALQALEELKPAGRAFLPGCESALAAATRQRDRLQQAKQALRPVEWRVADAMRAVAKKTAALGRCKATLEASAAERTAPEERLLA